MTINMGPANDGPLKQSEFKLGEEVSLWIYTAARDEKVMAVNVTTEVPSNNDVKHITIAVNREAGGKPAHSNNLKGWNQISQPFEDRFLVGIIEECK